MTTNIADLLKEKDDIIAQLEEKLIEQDNKMVDMQEELQAEMGENSDLAHNLEIVQEEKQKLEDKIEAMEKVVLSLKDKVVGLEKDNSTLRQHLDQVRKENTQLSTRLSDAPASSDPEKLELEKTIHDLNKQIQGLQLKLMERFEDQDFSGTLGPKQEDLLQSILILDSDLKEVNTLLQQLHERFNAFLTSLSGEAQGGAASLLGSVDQIAQRCQQLRESLQEGSQAMSPDPCGGDYLHTITVSTASSSTDILEEYKGLKSKFDRVVAELKKLKKEVNQVYSSYDALEKKDKQLQESVSSMQSSYKKQVCEQWPHVECGNLLIVGNTLDVPF